MHSVEVLGVRVDDVTMAEAVEIIGAYAREDRLRQVVTVNPEFIMIARQRPDFLRVLEQADLSLPDGANLVRAARWLGRPLRERVGGTDLLRPLASLAAQRGDKVFLLGAGEGIAREAGAKLIAMNPGLQIAGAWSGSPALEEEAEIVTRVNASGARFLFVAYGAPAQDLWIARNRDRLRVSVAIGVGGAFDFISGRTSRAPRWIQRMGFEWLFRLIRQPWRWRRQLSLLSFVWYVAREKMAG